MPIDYQRDDRRCRVIATSVGAVTLAETLALMDRQASEGAWSYSVLYDTRAGEPFLAPSDVLVLVKSVGTLTTQYGPRGPVALVVGDSARYSLGRRYSSLGELTALNLQVFTTIDDAERWLDLGQP